MTISKLDKQALIALRDPINAELAALGERLGVTFRVGNGSYGDGAEASFKLEIRVNDPATAEAAARAIWNRNCGLIDYERGGLRPEDFGTAFPFNGGVYRTTGIAVKGRGSQKFPILAVVVIPGRNGGDVGQTRMLPEAAAAAIRRATDEKRAA